MIAAVDIAGLLALKPREIRVLNWALWARTQVPNGHFLCSPGLVRSARRLSARGLLTEVPRKDAGLVTFGDNPDAWLVVRYSNENVDALKRQLKTAQRARARAGGTKS